MQWVFNPSSLVMVEVLVHDYNHIQVDKFISIHSGLRTSLLLFFSLFFFLEEQRSTAANILRLIHGKPSDTLKQKFLLKKVSTLQIFWPSNADSA